MPVRGNGFLCSILDFYRSVADDARLQGISVFTAFSAFPLRHGGLTKVPESRCAFRLRLSHSGFETQKAIQPKFALQYVFN